MYFKKISEKRASDHVNEVNTPNIINKLLPECDVTVGEACFDDYIAGYNQALKDTRFDEMLEMLKSFVNDFDNGLIEDFQIPRDRFEHLIKQATEL